MNDNFQHLPRRNWPACRWLGHGLLKLFGWRIIGPLPDLQKAVIVVAPHTSNWDWLIGMAAALALDLDANWLGKKSLFQGPWGKLLRKLGGIPVDRRQPAGILEQVIRQCRSKDSFLIGLSPEGTRKPVSTWKSGCCRLAAGAGIPLLPVAFDYSQKIIQVFDHWTPAADADPELCLARLSGCFRAEMARNPAGFRPHQQQGK
jgi:1-acyl-sn-glycerol-3-phosphate acyltransferase